MIIIFFFKYSLVALNLIFKSTLSKKPFLSPLFFFCRTNIYTNCNLVVISLFASLLLVRFPSYHRTEKKKKKKEKKYILCCYWVVWPDKLYILKYIFQIFEKIEREIKATHKFSFEFFYYYFFV